jgi:tetratricopeptide (TPR) repeat protein
MSDLAGEGLLEFRFQQAKLRFDARDWMGAILEAEELLEEAPDHLEALFLVGEASLELGDAHGADAAYARFLELVPRHPLALCGMAIARFELTDMDVCLMCTQAVLEVEEESPEAWYYQGLAQQWQGLTEEAKVSLDKAASLDGNRYPKVEPLPEASWNEALLKAYSLLDEGLSRWIQDVPLTSYHLPSLEVLRSAEPPLSPFSTGLYRGTPPPPGEKAWETHPEELRLYRVNLERLAHHQGDLPRRIAEVLRAEALDWLALPPEAHPLQP